MPYSRPLGQGYYTAHRRRPRRRRRRCRSFEVATGRERSGTPTDQSLSRSRSCPQFVDVASYLILEKHAITGLPRVSASGSEWRARVHRHRRCAAGLHHLGRSRRYLRLRRRRPFQRRRLPGLKLNDPPVAMAEKSDGSGYWIVDQAGAIFAFGSAIFYGYTERPLSRHGNQRGSKRLRHVGLLPATWPASGRSAMRTSLVTSTPGYWMIDDHGIVYGFGGAANWGSVPNGGGAVDIEPTFTSLGYWTVDATGGVFAFSDARLSPCAPVPASEK